MDLITVREILLIVLGGIVGIGFTTLTYAWIEPGEADDVSMGTWVIKKIKAPFSKAGAYELEFDEEVDCESN